MHALWPFDLRPRNVSLKIWRISPLISPVMEDTALTTSSRGGAAHIDAGPTIMERLERLLEFKAALAAIKEGRTSPPLPDSPTALQRLLEAERAENQRLRDSNFALQALSAESARLGALLAPTPDVSAMSRLLPPGASPAAVKTALEAHMWMHGVFPPVAVMEAYVELPVEAIVAMNLDFFVKLHHNAVKWTLTSGSRDELEARSTTARALRRRIVGGLAAQKPEKYGKCIQWIRPPKPGTPSGDDFLRKLAAVLQALSLGPGQKLKCERLQKTYCQNVASSLMEVAAVQASMIGADFGPRECDRLSLRSTAERALQIDSQAAAIQRCRHRIFNFYFDFHSKVMRTLTWVQFAMLLGTLLPCEPDARVLCAMICSNAA